MSRKPSDRSNIENNDPKELNMVPYLDIVTNIIMFMLFTSTAAGAIGVINVASPKIGGPPGGGGTGKDEKPPLNLSVFVTDKGFTVAATGGVLPGASAAEPDKKGGPTIPKNPSEAACKEMKRNENAPCYDYHALSKKLAEIKKVFPDETRLNLAADSEIPYYIIVNTMDATRENEFERDDMGKFKPLFYDVILAAGL
ncbi:MAG: biopolymer transporter ExbD [Deltaproteobacteria bacterium]|nr:biopolymer transporter ExbD [Deltaproteobacteria bacterium]